MSGGQSEDMMQLKIAHLHGMPFMITVPRNITVSGLRAAISSYLSQQYAIEVSTRKIGLRVKLSFHLPGRELEDEDNENFENLVRSYGVQDRGVVFLRFREPEDAAASGAGSSAHALPASMRHENLGTTTQLDANTAAALEGAGVSATINTRRPYATRRSGRRLGWDEAAVKDLVDGVTTFGVGRWKDILFHNKYSFPCSMDTKGAVVLKDKWRNLVKCVKTGTTPRSNVISPETLERIRALI